MDAIGFIASAAQISVYAFSIASLISEIRSAARNGPSILQERCQQLVILGIAVDKIRLDYTLHTDVLSGYLLTIQHKIRTLHNLVRLRSQRPANSSAQRLRTALSFVTRNKEFESSFAALQDHCQTLYIYMASAGSPLPTGSRTMEARRSSEENVNRWSTPSFTDTGKEVARSERTSRASQAPQVTTMPARQASIKAQGERYSNNHAGDESRQWFGNHAEKPDRPDFRGQEFEGNNATEKGDQVFGSSLAPPERNAERPSGEKEAPKK